MSDEENFEEQLRQEELAKVKDEEETVERQLGELYTDKDGTEYEWDPMKKAWFPKIDADFIARYQMSYGVNSDTSTEPNSTTNTDNKETAEHKNKDSEEYYKQYYDYYYNQGQGQSSEQSATSGDPHYDYYSYYGYDMSEFYGPQDEDEPTETEPEKTDTKEEKKKSKAEKRKEPPTWFEAEPDHLPNVYVSGLPSDITEQEFTELMGKCGLIVHDHETRKPKVKLYRTSDGNVKGDGLCCYIKHESVELALQILDESDVKGHKIHVERAKFELKGNYDPSKRRKKLTNKQKRKLKERQEKLFSWTPDKKELGGRGKNEKVVILQHVFDPKEFETEPTLINEIRADMRSECIKFGEVRKVVVHDHNPAGTVSIFYKTPEEADQCIAALNGRWFGGRQLKAATWDGKTKYDLEETEEERAKRLKEWESYLEAGDEGQKQVVQEKSSEPKPPSAENAASSSTRENSSTSPTSSVTPAQNDVTLKTDLTNNDDSPDDCQASSPRNL